MNNIDKHNCTKEEFYVLAKTKTEPVLDNVPEGEIYPPDPLVEMEVGEVLASTITESPAPAVTPEPKKSWKKVKAAK